MKSTLIMLMATAITQVTLPVSPTLANSHVGDSQSSQQQDLICTLLMLSSADSLTRLPEGWELRFDSRFSVPTVTPSELTQLDDDWENPIEPIRFGILEGELDLVNIASHNSVVSCSNQNEVSDILND